jgi:hypothetical protein
MMKAERSLHRKTNQNHCLTNPVYLFATAPHCMEEEPFPIPSAVNLRRNHNFQEKKEESCES